MITLIPYLYYISYKHTYYCNVIGIYNNFDKIMNQKDFLFFFLFVKLKSDKMGISRIIFGNEGTYLYKKQRYAFTVFFSMIIGYFCSFSTCKEYSDNFIRFEAIPQIQKIRMLQQLRDNVHVNFTRVISTVIEGNPNETDKYLLNEGHYENQGAIFFAPSALERTNATYVEVPYVYVSAFSGALRPTGKVIFSDISITVPRYSENGPVVACLEHVIALGSRWSIMYGHWICDCVMHLLFMPKEVMQKATYLLPVNSSIYRGALEVFGFTDDRIMYLNTSEWVFAEHFHIVYTPEMVHGCMVWGSRELARICKTRFECLNVTPTLYALYNRPPGNRHLANFQDFVFTVNVRFPHIRWVQLMTLYPTFKDSVIAYSHVKLLFGPTGSNYINMIFMSPGTATVCGVGDMNDGPVYGTAQSCFIWMVTFRVPGMRHHGLKPNYLDYELALTAIEKGIFVADHQRWPTKGELEE